MSENELAKAIECHIAMLMDEGELVRIGADKQPLRDLSLRIMRILEAYGDLQTEIVRVRETCIWHVAMEDKRIKHIKLIEAENAKLKAALEYYGNHDCDIAVWAGGKCDCGYYKALKDNGCKAETEAI